MSTMKTPDNVSSMWVIYFNPSDHPGKTLAREWAMGPNDRGFAPTSLTIFGELTELQKRFESQGMVNLGRNKNDDPIIVEVWA